MNTLSRRLASPRWWLLASLVCTGLIALQPGTALAETDNSAPVTERRALDSFDGIELSGSVDLVVRPADRNEAEVLAPQRLQPLLETVVLTRGERRVLAVRWKRDANVHTMRRVVVTVSAQRLLSLSADGSGDIVVEPFKTPRLALALNGSGDARLRGLDTDELSLAIHGSGDVTAEGRATRLQLQSAGSGDVQAARLAAEDATVAIAGSGDADLQVRRTLAVSIAGSGDVRYSGNPQLSSQVAGSGSVQRRR